MKNLLTKTENKIIVTFILMLLINFSNAQIHYCEDFHNAQFCTGVSSSDAGPIATHGTLTGTAPNQIYTYTGSSNEGFFNGTLTGDFSGFDHVNGNGDPTQFLKVNYYNGLINLALEWTNTQSYVCFESNVMDMSCADGAVSAKIYVDASDVDLDGSDHLDVFYVADGIETQVPDLSGLNSGFTIKGSTNVTTICLDDIPVNNSFQLKICAYNSSPSETYWVDNIIVDATGPNAACTSVPCFTPLPIELVSFEAKAVDRFNILNWSTATEENTEWHIIERSIDGKESWHEVGRIPAEGWSTNMQYYTLEDKNPLGTSYYRLKSLDFDGHIDLSHLVVVERAIDEFGIINVYPKPADEEVTIQYEVPELSTITLSITDLNGRILKFESYEIQNGIHTNRIPLDGLSPGLYLINLERQGQKMTQKFLKK